MGCTVFSYLGRIASLTIIISVVGGNEALSPQLFKHKSVGPLGWELNPGGFTAPHCGTQAVELHVHCTRQAMNMTAVSYIIKLVISIIYIFILLFQD